jgi:hypothetical protein
MNNEDENEHSYAMYRLLPACGLVAVAATFYTLLEWGPMSDPEGPIFGALKGTLVYLGYFALCGIILAVVRSVFGYDDT